MSTRFKLLSLIIAGILSAGILVLLYVGQARLSGGVPARYISLGTRPDTVTDRRGPAVMTHGNQSMAQNGNNIAEVFTAPVQWQDAHGRGKAVDTDIVVRGSHLEPRSIGFGLRFGRSFATPLTLTTGQSNLIFIPAGAASTEALTTGDRAIYRRVYQGTDVERVALSNGFKETYILQNEGHPTSFETGVETGLSPRTEPDGSIGYYNGGKRIAFSPAPFLIDKMGRHRRATYSLTKGKIRLALPRDMSGLKYPIRVDPTTYLTADASDGFIGYDDSGTAYVSAADPYLEVASDYGLWTANSWLRFPLAGITGPIVSATLNMYYYDRTYNSGSLSIPVDHVPDYGLLDEADWSTPPLASNIDPAPLTSSSPLGWHAVDVTSCVQDDLNSWRGASAYRMKVTGAGSWYARFNSSRSAGNKPYLRIVYSSDVTVLHSEITAPVDQGFVSDAVYLITGTAAPRLGGPAVTQVEVSTDGGATWNYATGTGLWSYEWTAPADGEYLIKARAGDGISTEVPGPGARVTVDRTPPATALTSPAPRQMVSGPLPLVGTATDAFFDNYVIEYAEGDAPTTWMKYGAAHTLSIFGGTLETINTLRLKNDTYTFRVTAYDRAGNSSSASVAVVVNNGLRPGSPHGNFQLDTDVCALCHGTHTALLAPGILKLNALEFQSQLCYTCHNGTGSIYDVATEFDTNPSHHPIKDPTYKSDATHTLNCSDCHDAHGSEEVGGKPYPRLLRSKDASGALFYQGNPFCYACHGQGGKIKDLRYFETNNGHSNSDPGQTTMFPEPGSNTKISCTRCHKPHGSQQAKLRQDSDKQMCGVCHPDTPYSLRTDNEVVTGVGYANANTEPFYAGIRVFSQNTFNAAPVGLKGPKEYRVPPLNYPPSTKGMAIGDATNDGQNDVVETIWNSQNTLAVFPQDAGTYAIKPASLFNGYGGYGVAIGDVDGDGRNETVVTGVTTSDIRVTKIMGATIVSSMRLASGGTQTRGLAIGDINGDSLNDVVVANYGSNSISVFEQMTGGVLALAQTISSGGTQPYEVAIGDVNNDGKNEVVVTNTYYAAAATPPFTQDNIAVFTQSGGNLVLSTTLSNGPATVGWDVAIGDVLGAAPGKEIICAGHPMYSSGVTTPGDLTVFSITAGTTNTYSTGALDSKGVAVGDIDGDGKDDAVVLNADSLSVFTYGNTSLSGPVFYDMPGSNTVGYGDEPALIAIGNVGKLHPYGHRVEATGNCAGACHDPHSVTKANPLYGVSGYDPSYSGYPSRSLIIHTNPLVNYSGTWFHYAATSFSCSQASGSYFQATFTGDGFGVTTGHSGIGNAGTGQVYIDGRYETTVDFAGVQAGKETEPFYNKTGLTFGTHTIRIVVTGMLGSGGGAPFIYVQGLMPYADFGRTTVEHVTNDVQLCLTCHSRWGSPMVGTHDLADELNPGNPSYHAVLAAGRRNDIPVESFIAPWTQTSRLACRDCHDNAAAGPQLQHGSVYASYLKKQYLGMKSGSSSTLCYSCHSFDFYYPPTYVVPSTYTWYRNNSRASHGIHTRRGMSCPTCHDVHGSVLYNGLIRPEMNFRPGVDPGTFECGGGCHPR